MNPKPLFYALHYHYHYKPDPPGAIATETTSQPMLATGFDRPRSPTPSTTPHSPNATHHPPKTTTSV
ncbi:MAG TPA: hypothetical protein V6D46_10275 [Coleofasciculaceae cyanobacterium]